jgi:putative colanic acid biosynthesis acetyltransferase WcaF
MNPVRLQSFDNSWYRPGRSLLCQLAWFFVGLPLLRSGLIPSSSFRVRLLRLFGAKVGSGVVIKPGVRVKYPWRLTVGNHCWLGEDCWIDNLADIRLGNNVCVSQGVYFCTGNHDWTDPAFGLIVKSIVMHDGSWAGAKAVLVPGVTVGECAIAAAGSVVMKDIPPFEIHAGNPAIFVKERRVGAQRLDRELPMSERVAS